MQLGRGKKGTNGGWLDEAVRTAGNAITITALIIIIGVVFWAGSTIKFQADMGLMLSVVTCMHLIGTLFLLPALVRVVRPSFIVQAGVPANG